MGVNVAVAVAVGVAAGVAVGVGLGLGVRVAVGLGVGVAVGVGVAGGRLKTLFCNSVKIVVLRRIMSESLVVWTVASVPGSK